MITWIGIKAIYQRFKLSDELLNAEGKSRLGGGSETLEAKKTLITDNINPDLILLQSALNKLLLQFVQGYENCVIEWDKRMPEIRADEANSRGIESVAFET